MRRVPQQKERPKRRKKKKAAKLSFEAGKVFSVKSTEEVDVDLDRDCAQFAAKKGEAGDRSAG